MVTKEECLKSDFHDTSIFPVIKEYENKIIEEQNSYMMKKCWELNINPNILENQLMEIHRLNNVIDRLDKAFTLACEDITDVFGNCPLDQFNHFTSKCENCQDEYKECWKEYYMSEVFGDESN